MKLFNFAKTKILKDILRNPYIWPGGYERLAVTSDGALICALCCKANAEVMLHSTLLKYSDGWEVVDQCYEAVSSEYCTDDLISYCAHCYKPIGELA